MGAIAAGNAPGLRGLASGLALDQTKMPVDVNRRRWAAWEPNQSAKGDELAPEVKASYKTQHPRTGKREGVIWREADVRRKLAIPVYTNAQRLSRAGGGFFCFDFPQESYICGEDRNYI
ncbi:hypothetical protein [Xanthobacter autotrophicus]|uniref:hypothetical protein n=1 Tax=Xanthobacter autotrophicus TaxID=280 RepID=UPI0037280240